MAMRRILAVVTIAVLVAGCEPAPRTLPATVLYFVEQEPGEEAYRTRMLITAGHVRIDDGRPDGDYTLYARRDRVIYSVTAGDKMVLTIRPGPDKPPSPIRLEHRAVRERGEAPPVGGKAVVRWRLLTNDKTCYDIHAADGLLPQAVTALREFIETLARDQAGTLAHTPKEMQTPCHLANNVFAAARYLDHGLPVRRADMTGRVSELVDYREEFAAEPALFTLPESFRRVDIRELRGK
jgi:hypothetical protein